MHRYLIIIGIFVSLQLSGQESKTKNFLSEISNYDFSQLWTSNKILVENETKAERDEPLGYIGDNYQRFYIHFISANQNPGNKQEYLIYGKTLVKDNICSFQGKLFIKEARTYLIGDLPPLKQGYVKGWYEFYEDQKQKGSGKLSGSFTTYFYIDSKGKIQYDALNMNADGYNNNQFEGIWTSYKTNETKKCNWGDYRIPDSKQLDCGAAEFSVSDRYVANGWLSYMLATSASPDRADPKGYARKEEHRKWWLEKRK
ncbi:MAG: hypothetical protein Q8909_12890 [Bacteroidota bacterium]|nr:hypothetical protein [Bacteroidota bacterium]